MANKPTVEFIGIIVKINGKKKIFEKETLHFRGWEEDCDSCGSHSGVTVEIFEEKKTHKIELESS